MSIAAQFFVIRRAIAYVVSYIDLFVFSRIHFVNVEQKLKNSYVKIATKFAQTTPFNL